MMVTGMRMHDADIGECRFRRTQATSPMSEREFESGDIVELHDRAWLWRDRPAGRCCRAAARRCHRDQAVMKVSSTVPW